MCFGGYMSWVSKEHVTRIDAIFAAFFCLIAWWFVIYVWISQNNKIAEWLNKDLWTGE